MTVRGGENQKTWFRTDRIQNVNNQWYFMTRESTQVGPFGSRREAELELNLYIRHANDHFYQQLIG